MHAGCECNVVIATCPLRDLESTFLRCDNVAFTTLPQPKHNVVTTLSQRDFVCWVDSFQAQARKRFEAVRCSSMHINLRGEEVLLFGRVDVLIYIYVHKQKRVITEKYIDDTN